MAKDPKNSEDIKTIADKIKDALLGINTDEGFAAVEAGKIFTELSQNDEFEQEIEQMLAILSEQTMDLTKLQTQIILLIRKYLGKTKSKDLLLKLDENQINQNVAEVSNYLMQQHAIIAKETDKGLGKSKERLQTIGARSRANFKLLVKNFAVYQVYKFMNPKRIAGETRKENFAHNMINGGMKLASHYEGGSKSDIKSYSPQFIKKLENAHKAFNSGGRSL